MLSWNACPNSSFLTEIGINLSFISYTLKLHESFFPYFQTSMFCWISNSCPIYSAFFPQNIFLIENHWLIQSLFPSLSFFHILSNISFFSPVLVLYLSQNFRCIIYHFTVCLYPLCQQVTHDVHSPPCQWGLHSVYGQLFFLWKFPWWRLFKWFVMYTLISSIYLLFVYSIKIVSITLPPKVYS